MTKKQLYIQELEALLKESHERDERYNTNEGALTNYYYREGLIKALEIFNNIPF